MNRESIINLERASFLPKDIVKEDKSIYTAYQKDKARLKNLKKKSMIIGK